MTAKDKIVNCFNSQKDFHDPMPSEEVIRPFMDKMSEQQAQALIDAASAFMPEGFGGPEVTAAFIINFLLSWNTAITAAQDHPETLDTLKDHLANNIVYDGSEAENSFFKELASILSGSAEEDVQSFKSVAPDKYLIPTGKLERAIAERGKGNAEVIKGSGKNSPPVTISFVLHFDSESSKEAKLLGPRNISKFDMAILSAVISLLMCNNVVITPAMAYRTMAGWDATHDITPKQEEAAKKSIEKLRKTFIDCDATGAIQRYCKDKGLPDDGSEWNVDEALLICGGLQRRMINGKIAKAYLFDNYDKKGNLKMPFVARLALKSKQILALPMELADMTISATESNIILRNYLWMQIGAIKNPKARRRPEISYEGIYKELGIDLSTDLGRKHAQRAREATEKLLQNWKQKGAIKSFATYKKDKKAAGVKVEA